MATIEDSLYKAFSKAETGGVSDPWIRTYGVPGSSSTAYGPVQITATLARDYLKRYADLFNEEEKDYLNRFLEQGKQFIKFGREPDREGYDPRYDYGGSGDLTSTEDKAMYERVAKKMLMQHYRNNKGNLSDTIKEWRFGAASDKGRSADERYWKEVEETFVAQPYEPESEQPEQYDMLLSEIEEESASRGSLEGEPVRESSVSLPDGFPEQFMAMMREVIKASQSRSQEVSKPPTEPDVLKGREAAPFAPELDAFIQGVAEVNVQDEPELNPELDAFIDRAVRAMGTEETEAPVYAEEPQGGQDDSKDPIYGLF